MHNHANLKRKDPSAAVTVHAAADAAANAAANVAAIAAAHAAVNAIVAPIKITNVPSHAVNAIVVLIKIANVPLNFLKKKQIKNKSLSQLHLEIKKHLAILSIQMTPSCVSLRILKTHHLIQVMKPNTHCLISMSI